MKITYTILLLAFISCNNTEYVRVPGETEMVEIEKTVIENNTITEIVEVETEVLVTEIVNNTITEVIEVEIAQEFEGFYNLQYGGFIELVANARGDITVEITGQNILTKNPNNGTICEHPRIVGTDLQIIDGAIKWTRNETYTVGQDVEENTTGANIIGIRKTDYTLRMVNGTLNIRIDIWSDKIGNNINFIVASRTIKEY